MFFQYSVVPFDVPVVQVDEIRPFQYFVPNISLQPDINGNYYTIYSPIGSNACNMMLNCEVQTNIPNHLPKIHNNTPMNIRILKVDTKDQMNGDVRREKKQLKKKDHYKSKACWHFRRGYCERGKSCGFRHCVPDATKKSRKFSPHNVSSHITEDALRKELSDLGCKVNRKGGKQENPWPRAYPTSNTEAQSLFQKQKILHTGYPGYNSPEQDVFNKENDRINDAARRSVFLGGLPRGVTCKMIRIGLEKLKARVVSIVQVKRGFCPKVTLATVHQALALISAGTIEINGTYVDVRPYLPRRAITGSVKNAQKWQT